MIRGANHCKASDSGAMLKSPLAMRAMRTLGIVRLDGRRQVAVTVHGVSTFFDAYLKGAPASKLISQPEYPEIEYAIARCADGSRRNGGVERVLGESTFGQPKRKFRINLVGLYNLHNACTTVHPRRATPSRLLLWIRSGMST
jgi:hypothetical protein